MNMKLTTWYVQWFFWSCHVIDRFCLTSNQRDYISVFERYQNGTNLCRFFHVLFLGVAINAIIVIWYASLLFIVFVLPFRLFSAYNIGFSMMVVALIIAAMVAFVVVLWRCVVLLRRFLDYRAAHPKPPKEVEPFMSVFWAYLKALKERYCPIIKFEG
jgi:hypothetical protein